MTDVGTISLIVSISSLVVGIILSVVAIVLSVTFFVFGKKTETQTSSLLTEIKSETSQLHSTNDRILTKALGSLSQIAKQKTTAETSAMMEQAAAAIHEAVAALPERMAEFSIGQLSTAPQSTEAQDSSNHISDHQLPDLPDPFSKKDLELMIIAFNIHYLNAIGWLNTYGQQALLQYSNTDQFDSLVLETAGSLDRSATLYRRILGQLTTSRQARPELWTNHPSVPLFDSTGPRLNHFIGSYREVCEKFGIPPRQDYQPPPDNQPT